MKKITREYLEKFLEKYKTDKKVLDVGSGGSSYGRYFPNRLTIDIDPKRNPEIVADAHNLPFKDGEFEFILCTEVLEHVLNPRQVISEFNRVLKKGGLLLLTTRFVYPIHDSPYDYWRFTKFGMIELFKGWEILELQTETKTFSTIGALLQRIIFQTSLKMNKLLKLFILIFSKLFVFMDKFIIKEYGDIKRETSVDNMMTTGYYIICKK